MAAAAVTVRQTVSVTSPLEGEVEATVSFSRGGGGRARRRHAQSASSAAATVRSEIYARSDDALQTAVVLVLRVLFVPRRRAPRLPRACLVRTARAVAATRRPASFIA